jgi:putative endonuclease
VNTLVWLEARDTIEVAIGPEKQIKEWKRELKLNLIERDNPHWTDLYPCLSP